VNPRRFAYVLMIALSLLPTAGASASAGPAGEGVPSLGHVFVIIGENSDYKAITATNSPYMITTLKPRSAWLSSYYAATHWSQANYVALMSGQFNRCQQQDGGIACHQDVNNLYHQLDLAGIGWKTWLEDEGQRCGNLVPNGTTEVQSSTGDCVPHGNCPLTGFYTTGNPPINFDNIEGPGGVFSATTPSEECLARDVQAGQEMEFFNADLAAGTIPRFNFVIPNGCEDANGNCAPIHNRYTQFDTFLAREIPLIQASPAYGRNDLIIVLFDEDMRTGGMQVKDPLAQGGHTVCLLIGPRVKPGAYGRKTYSYSVLRTLQDGYRVGPFLGHAADVRTIDQIWR
jgi:phosphatidylinositol-3-phosphatase